MTALVCGGLGGADLEVACDFGSGYIDITSYVKVDAEVPITRGRQDETSRAEPSHLTLTVNNTDGRFTPGNRSSPNWPGVRLRTPIRVRVRHPHTTGTWRVRFTGFVDEWPTNWPSKNPSTVAWSSISASGLLRPQSRSATLPSAIRARMAIAAPDFWWPLEDAADAVFAEPETGAVTLSTEGTVAFAGVAGTVGMGRQVARLDPAGRLTIPPLRSAVRTMEVWWQYTDASHFTLHTSDGANSDVFEITSHDVNTHGGFTVDISALVATTVAAGPEFVHTNLVEDDWWHVVATLSGSGASCTLSLYVNGVLVDSDIGTATPTFLHDSGYVLAGGTGSNPPKVGVAHVAVYDTALAAVDVLANFTAGVGNRDDLTGDRFNRLGDESSIVTTATAATGEAMGPQPSGNLPTLLQDCAGAEQGFMYEDLSGGLTLQMRTARNNPATYLSLAIPGQIDSVDPLVDDQHFLNEATVSRASGGVPTTYTDAASVAEVEATYSRDVSVNVAADEQLLQHAGWLVNTSTKLDMPRYPSLSFRFAAAGDSASLITWLAGEPLGSMLALSGLPTQAVSSTESVFVEGYTETWSYTVCRVVANCSPVEPRDRIYVCENGGALSAMGLDGQTVDTGIDAVTTTLLVATAGGKPLLTTAGGDYPQQFRNVTTNEVFTVTACSGASSPQTLTITRGTPAAAMSVGHVLELAVKPVLAL